MERLTLPGTLDSLAAIGKYVLAAASEAGLDKKAAYRLRLAVDEIATNAVVHGYEETGCDGPLDIWAQIDGAGLTIALEDTGPAYDPRATPAPDNLDRPLEERSIGGLGVLLANLGVDELGYERVGDCNRSIFIVRSPGPAPDRA